MYAFYPFTTPHRREPPSPLTIEDITDEPEVVDDRALVPYQRKRPRPPSDTILPNRRDRAEVATATERLARSRYPKKSRVQLTQAAPPREPPPDAKDEYSDSDDEEQPAPRDTSPRRARSPRPERRIVETDSVLDHISRLATPALWMALDIKMLIQVVLSTRQIIDKCESIHLDCLRYNMMWDGVQQHEDTPLFRSIGDSVFHPSVRAYLSAHGVITKSVHARLINAKRLPVQSTVAGYVCLARLYLTATENIIHADRAVAVSQLSSIGAPSMVDSIWSTYSPPTSVVRLGGEIRGEIIFTDTFRLHNVQTIANAAVSRTVIELFQVVDIIMSEVVQSLSSVHRGSPPLKSVTGKWRRWTHNMLSFFAYIVVTLRFSTPAMIEHCSRLLFGVESQLDLIAKAHVLDATVTDADLKRMQEVIDPQIRRQPVPDVVSKILNDVHRCFLPCLLREAYCSHFPGQSRDTAVGEITNAVFTNDYVSTRIVGAMAGQKDKRRFRAVMNSPDHQETADILRMFLFAVIFKDERSIDWLDQYVIFPSDWGTRHVTLYDRKHTDPHMSGRPVLPFIISLLGRWCVWAYVPMQSTPHLYDCGTAAKACMQWVRLVKDHFHSRLDDGLPVPDSIMQLVQ